MVCIGNSFGMYPKDFFPTEAGPNYTMTPLLAPLERHRKDFNIFSHLDHDVKGGHFFRAHLPERGEDGRRQRNAGRQYFHRSAGCRAYRSGDALPVFDDRFGRWITRRLPHVLDATGVRVPPIEGPRELFRKLFINEGQRAKQEAADNLELRGSILDSVLSDAKNLERRLGGQDKEKLDEYLTSVRDVEVSLELDKRWSSVPKPKAPDGRAGRSQPRRGHSGNV